MSTETRGVVFYFVRTITSRTNGPGMFDRYVCLIGKTRCGITILLAYGTILP